VKFAENIFVVNLVQKLVQQIVEKFITEITSENSQETDAKIIQSICANCAGKVITDTLRNAAQKRKFITTATRRNASWQVGEVEKKGVSVKGLKVEKLIALFVENIFRKNITDKNIVRKNAEIIFQQKICEGFLQKFLTR